MQTKWRIFLPFFALLWTSITLYGNDSELLEKANNLYKDKKYTQAIESYQMLINERGYEMDELYYNQGNAYYKNGNISMAIWSYEKALKIAPDHKDAKFNLAFANRRTIDKIDPLPTLFIERIWKSTITSMSSNSWAKYTLFFIYLALFCLVSYLFVRLSRYKKIAFYLGSLFLIVGIFCWIFGESNKSYLSNNKVAIVLSPSVTIVNEPSEQAQEKLFTIHEGAKVFLLQESGEWSEIRLVSGKTGWVKKAALVFV